jgi:histidine ammonia-lyase
MSPERVVLDGASLTPVDVSAVARGGAAAVLDPQARRRNDAARLRCLTCWLGASRSTE